MTIIATKVIPATNTKPTRILAVIPVTNASQTVPVSFKVSAFENHVNAARKLAQERGIEGRFVGSVSPEGYVFVLDNHLGFVI